MKNDISPTGWNDKFSKPMIKAFEKIKKDFNCNDAPYIWKLMREFCSQSIDEAALSMIVDEIYNDIEKYRKIYNATPEELRKCISINITEGKFDDINNISVFDVMDVLAEYLDSRDTSDKNDN